MFIWTLGDIVGVGVAVVILIWFAYGCICSAVSENISHKKKPAQPTQAQSSAPKKKQMTPYEQEQKKKADKEANDLLFYLYNDNE